MKFFKIKIIFKKLKLIISYFLYSDETRPKNSINYKSNFFKQLGPGTWKFIDSLNSKLYNIDLKENFCNCKYFLKYKYCGHLIALMQLLNSDDFINKPKRGAQRKALKPLVKDN